MQDYHQRLFKSLLIGQGSKCGKWYQMRFLFVYCVGPGGIGILWNSSLLPSSSSSFVFIYNLCCVYLCKIHDAAYSINEEVGRNKAKVPRQDGETLPVGISLDWRLEGNGISVCEEACLTRESRWGVLCAVVPLPLGFIRIRLYLPIMSPYLSNPRVPGALQEILRPDYRWARPPWCWQELILWVCSEYWIY